MEIWEVESKVFLEAAIVLGEQAREDRQAALNLGMLGTVALSLSARGDLGV